MARGFYSVIQYVPDRFRAETVNVDLVVLRLQPHALRVRMAGDFDRTRRLFRIGQPELKNLEISASGLKFRIESSIDELRTAEDFAAFAALRANDLRLTGPRVAVLENIEADFERLFSQLVDDQTVDDQTVEAQMDILT